VTQTLEHLGEPALLCPSCLGDRHIEHTLTAAQAGQSECSLCGFRPGRTTGGAPTALSLASQSSDYYEHPGVRDEYLAFHFPDPAHDTLRSILGSSTPPPASLYPAAVRALWSPIPEGRALDVGCACGAVTLDLARDHEVAIGLDRSPLLIDAARAVASRGEARYATVLEGDLRTQHVVPIQAASGARFLVADALTIPFPSGAFATVVALNLIDRVPDPARAVAEMARVVRPGGLLLVGSPYTWKEAFTPRDRWLGGLERGDEKVRGPQTVHALLRDRFLLERESRLPFFIPHHARSGQLGLAHVQSFRRET
jgi:SAM-dependent methyltransferase